MHRLLRSTALVLIALFTSLTLTLVAYGGQAYAVERTAVEGLVEAAVSDVNAFWGTEFGQRGYPYAPARLAFVYDEPVASGCGPVLPQLGPGYCAIDGTFYYPVNWVDPLTGLRLEEYGDFAVAMVTAHEMAHHAQFLMDSLGIQRLDNLSLTQFELQADCFAGAWTRRAYDNGQLEPGDLEEALSALGVAGSPGHGTSQQRSASFMLGYDTGDIAECLTMAS